MRILLVNTTHFRGGGPSTYTLGLAQSLRDRGHVVGFFAMQSEQNLPDPHDDLFVSHIDFRQLNRNKSILSGLRVLRRAIYSREAKEKFGRLIDRFRPDLVHLQNIHNHITPSVVFAAKRRDLPVVWTLHDYKMICPNSYCLVDTTHEICEACGAGHYFQAARKCCKKGSLLASSVAALEAYAHRAMGVRERVDMFVTPSAFLRDKLLERGFPSRRVIHLPLFVPAVPQNSRREGGYLLFLGKLEAVKGVHVLLEACHRVPEVEVLMAGRIEEPLASQLPTLLPPNTRYIGIKHGEELQQLLLGALAVVMPSVWYENQPFSILEAFASGKPVIASNLGGMRELVAAGRRGMLVPPGDSAALAEAMRWMAAHPHEAGEMGDAARQYASLEHNPEDHCARLVEIYQRLLDERASAPAR